MEPEERAAPVDMADDDDDGTFGEFAFSAFRSDALDSKSNGVNSLEDDYEWGDFVKSPQQPHTSDPPFNSFIGNGNSPSKDLASPIGWVKPSGELPLSIFGADEEEEEEDPADLDRERSDANAGDVNSYFTDNSLLKSKNFSIDELYSRSSPINAENVPASDFESRFDLMEKDSISIPAENGFHSSSDLDVARSDYTVQKIADFDGAVGRNYQNQFMKNDEDEFGVKLDSSKWNQNTDFLGGWALDFNEFRTNSNAVYPNGNSGMDMNDGKPKLSVPASDDDSDDGWEFQGAYSEARTIDLSDMVDSTTCEVSAKGTNTNEAVNLFGTANESFDLFAMPTESVDFFANSTGISHSPREVDLDSIPPSIASLHITISDTNLKVKQNGIEGTQNCIPDVGSTESDIHFGDFTSASAETRPKTGDKGMNLNDHRSAIPLSIFGAEELAIDHSLDVQDAFMHQSSSGKENHSPKSVISINDLISSLYNETEKTSFSNTAQKPTTVQLNFSNSQSRSNLVNDGLDDTSWEFKDAFSQTRVDNKASLYSSGDTSMSASYKLKLDNYLDFYFELKKVLSLVSKHHIESLKSPGNAALSVEDASTLLYSEFEMACLELERMDYLFEENEKQDNHSSSDSYLIEFIEILLKPQFQILESEYQLSQKLLLVEKDLKSTMELIRHTIAMLKILTLGTSEERMTYISIWSDIICVCGQELKDGALIWAQAVEKHVQSRLLAETEGRNFVLALGEIYRVVVLLGASAKLFKPWTISASVDLSSIYIWLEECHALWSTSGLEEALSSISVSTASEDASLLISIKKIRALDAPTLQNYDFTEKDSICRLSILSPGLAPGMKMIKWEENQYFVTLANLWANLVSRNPPKLPQLCIC